MHITLGNLNQGHVFTGTPTKASQLFTAQGNWKFTVSGATPGQKIVVLNDLTFHAFLGIQQSQNALCNFGPTQSDGVLALNPPHSTVVHNQAQVVVYKQAKSGFCDVASAPYLTFEIAGASPCTFLANIG